LGCAAAVPTVPRVPFGGDQLGSLWKIGMTLAAANAPPSALIRQSIAHYAAAVGMAAMNSTHAVAILDDRYPGWRPKDEEARLSGSQVAAQLRAFANSLDEVLG